jgi:hypothetical protein
LRYTQRFFSHLCFASAIGTRGRGTPPSALLVELPPCRSVRVGYVVDVDVVVPGVRGDVTNFRIGARAPAGDAEGRWAQLHYDVSDHTRRSLVDVGSVSRRDAEGREGVADLARGGEQGNGGGAKAVGVTRPGYYCSPVVWACRTAVPAKVLLLAVEVWAAAGTASNTPASTARITAANKRLPFTPITSP